LRDRPEKQLFLPQEMRMTDNDLLNLFLWEYEFASHPFHFFGHGLVQNPCIYSGCPDVRMSKHFGDRFH